VTCGRDLPRTLIKISSPVGIRSEELNVHFPAGVLLHHVLRIGDRAMLVGGYLIRQAPSVSARPIRMRSETLHSRRLIAFLRSNYEVARGESTAIVPGVSVRVSIQVQKPADLRRSLPSNGAGLLRTLRHFSVIGHLRRARSGAGGHDLLTDVHFDVHFRARLSTPVRRAGVLRLRERCALASLRMTALGGYAPYGTQMFFTQVARWYQRTWESFAARCSL
jgi:hypothetical protein